MGSIQGRQVRFPLTATSRAIFESIIISRRSVHDESDEVLRTVAGLAFIEAGVTTWRFSLDSPEVLSRDLQTTQTPSTGEADVPARIEVTAEWVSQPDIAASSIAIRDGGNANVFQHFGVVLVPRGFQIPVITATTRNVRHYGLTLFEQNAVIQFDSPEYALVLARYQYASNYRRDFLTLEQGGGGYFVERHNFPHLHAPLQPDCDGCMLVGQQTGLDSYEFTGFRIPYGTALYTPPDVIHGDGCIVGEHAITVASASAIADTVLFYNNDTRVMAPDAVAPNG